ncbi:MAG: hypothetical protein A3J28_04880 [Acidobacteria bacterium RIFCSPLOWO2_12_FULL_60_22]|nr:MAG: hypothetical protein A3J28_04880 [Acidobacteria bacterium RIFCSPLOWO2_12_FULL_60_22]
MPRNQRLWAFGLALCLGAPWLLFGQATSSAISGLVRDPSQAVISGATVTVTNVETGINRVRETDSQGRYRFGDLTPGTYQVTVSMAGFSRETRKDLVVLVGQELPVNFALQVGAVEQEVVVTGEAPVVETTISSVATNVSQEQLRELPLNGRAFTDLVTLNPGAVTPHVSQGRGPNYGFATQLSVAGARTDANTFRIDGTDMMDTRNMNPGSAAGVQLGVDTIREFQVVTTNGKAEYGRNAGAVINAVSRSGTNEWHGSAFEFLRNDKLDARRFEDPGDLPPFKRNQFGGTFGGPIKQDKTFFFLGYEGLRQRLNESAVWNVPTAEGRRGIGVLEPGEVVDPRIVPYLNLYPLPNGAILGGGIGLYVADESQPTMENFGSARIDHNISENDFFFARYTGSRADSSKTGNLLSPQVSTSSRHLFTMQEDHIFSHTLLNTFRVGFNRSFGFSAPGQVKGGENLGFAPGVPLGELEAGNGSVISTLGPAGIGIVDDLQNAFQYEDNVTYTRGAHTMKFGAMAERFQWNSDNPAFWQGSYNFFDLREMLLVRRVDPVFRLPESSTNRGLRTWLLAFFAQDDYRVTPSLTLNLGFRWEFTTGISEVNNKIAYLRNGPLTSTLNDLVQGKLWENHMRNFEPRLGFNWAIGQDQKTSLSGGFGIYHNQILHNSFVSFRDQLPFNFRASPQNLDARSAFPDIEGVVRAAGLRFNASRHFDFENFKVPTFYRYNLTVQRQLPGEMAARIGYVGALGRHMARRQLLNVFPQPVVQPDGSLFFPRTPVPQALNPGFGRIEWMSSDVNSTYSSLVASLQKRFSRGLTFQANYTWSKSLDDFSQSETNYSGQTGANAQWGPDRSLDRARSTFNVPHVFVFNGIYELPVGPGKPFLNSGGVAAVILGGWQIGGIVTLQQGLPFTVGSLIADAGFTFRANRPNLKPGVDVNKLTGGPRNRYFDTSAFDRPAAGTVGNAARNLLIGPDLQQVNFTLSKVFALTERTRLQFRSEFFNLFNRVQLRNPNARVFSNRTSINPAAGRIDESLDNSARQIQFGLKLTF